MTERPRPTTPPSVVDVSHGRPGTSAEAALFSAYRRIGPRYRTEPCACGGEIRAEVGWEAAAVDEHNSGPLHQRWRKWLRKTHQ